VGSPELLEPQDSSVAEVDADGGDSILSLEPGEFSYECRLASVDSLPYFPNTPEDSDDEYYQALVVHQANEVHSMDSSGDRGVADSKHSRGPAPCMCVAGIHALRG